MRYYFRRKRGIGRQLAAAYCRAGARVTLGDIDAKHGEAAAAAMRAEGGTAQFVAADMRRPGDIAGLVERAANVYGAVDIVINNAGIGRWKSPYELTLEEWDDVLNTNLRGTFLCAREAAARMRQSGRGGSIVNIASTRAFMSEPNSEAYAASKGGIVALTHALAVSLGPDRIRVNCISPGWIETGDYDALREADHAQHPAGRVGMPQDIVKACFYLTDPDNSFVTGANITVDGGMTRKMMYLE
ncbi:3-ketoacyl-ACP reductase [Gordoniibacillus kamchatkensis]|uniref:3-ketoacyl-ACP reductase n=1 Tax=Gordoniibacillus kamchatkensis TaxID=1590651 RepID=A0ABR5AKC9_9BACL|nr:3-ketoacyl-ACP reductase [Paenibacillus sp. VKM B-2647]